MRYVHLNGSLFEFHCINDLMIHSHINHVVSHSQDLDSFHITNTADKFFRYSRVQFISFQTACLCSNYSCAPYKQRMRQCPTTSKTFFAEEYYLDKYQSATCCYHTSITYEEGKEKRIVPGTRSHRLSFFFWNAAWGRG